MDERSDIYLNTQIPNPFRQYTYDGIVNELRRQFAGSPYAKAYAFEDLFPEPPGMAEFRVRRDLALAEAARLQREQGGDADLQRRGGGLSGRN